MGKVPGDARGKPRNLPIRKYKELLNRWGYYLGRVFFWFKTDVRTQTALEIVSVVAGANDVSDAEALPDLLQDVPVEIEQVSAAGACNKRKCYDTLNKHGAKAAIPPRKGAKIWQRATTKAERHVRDENLRQIRKVWRKEWKCENGYNRWSLATDSGLQFQDNLRRSVAN